MDRHYTKVDFHGISFMVIAFEVLSALSLLFGGVGALYIMFTQQGDIWSFIIISFGGIAAAFILFSIAEFLQLLMKIEVNTRRTEALMEKRSLLGRKRS